MSWVSTLFIIFEMLHLGYICLMIFKITFLVSIIGVKVRCSLQLVASKDYSLFPIASLLAFHFLAKSSPMPFYFIVHSLLMLNLIGFIRSQRNVAYYRIDNYSSYDAYLSCSGHFIIYFEALNSILYLCSALGGPAHKYIISSMTYGSICTNA